jgi:hypothetical protein
VFVILYARTNETLTQIYCFGIAKVARYCIKNVSKISIVHKIVVLAESWVQMFWFAWLLFTASQMSVRLFAIPIADAGLVALCSAWSCGGYGS